MAMKREVPRLGGYRREFFVSQTPELAAMADAVIDLDELSSAKVDPSGMEERTPSREKGKSAGVGAAARPLS